MGISQPFCFVHGIPLQNQVSKCDSPGRSFSLLLEYFLVVEAGIHLGVDLPMFIPIRAIAGHGRDQGNVLFQNTDLLSNLALFPNLPISWNVIHLIPRILEDEIIRSL
jgi:hypothetical protein